MKEYAKVKIEKLIPYVNNARTHSPEQINKLRSSLREFGFVAPVLIDEKYNIIAGHGRVMAAKEEGMAEVPCVFVNHLTEAQKKAYILADNRLALDAGWNEELVTLELEQLDMEGFDLSLTGFTTEELGVFMEGFNDTQGSGGTTAEGLAQDDEFDAGKALEEAAFVNEGELWTVGRHKMLCGDATNEENVNFLFGDNKAWLIVTDPPYNVGYRGKQSSKLKIKNDRQNDEAFYEFLLKSFQNMLQHCEPGAVIYVFYAILEGANFKTAFRNAGFNLAEVLVWNKNIMVLGHQDYQWKHEPILYGWNSAGPHRWFSDRCQTTVWDFKRPQKSDEHPTMKPLDLISYPILNSSQEGEIVMDLFGGSGSTLMACEKTGRICYTSELDPKYASVILRRYVADTGDAANVYTVRKGKKVYYADVVKEVEKRSKK